METVKPKPLFLFTDSATDGVLGGRVCVYVIWRSWGLSSLRFYKMIHRICLYSWQWSSLGMISLEAACPGVLTEPNTIALSLLGFYGRSSFRQRFPGNIQRQRCLQHTYSEVPWRGWSLGLCRKKKEKTMFLSVATDALVTGGVTSCWNWNEIKRLDPNFSYPPSVKCWVYKGAV